MSTRLQEDIILAHSSDLHLDHRAHYEDLLWPLRHVVQAARRVEANLLLLVGDTFEHNRMPLSFLQEAAHLMGEAGLPIVILPGNHDPLTEDSVHLRGEFALVPNVRVIGTSEDEFIHFADLDLEIWGRAHRDYSDMKPLSNPPSRRARWQVVMAHGHFSLERPKPGVPCPSWLIFDDEIRATGADYVALGHWNVAVEVGDGTVPAFYSGSPDLEATINVIRLGAGGTIVSRERLHNGT